MSILDRIQAHGGDVIRDEWRFRLQVGRLTPDALTWLRAKGRWSFACREVWPLFDSWQERAAIRQYDGGMSRADAERLAYGDVVQC